MHAHALHKDAARREALLPKFERKTVIGTEIAVLSKSAKAAAGLTFRSQLKGMKRVLRRLGHVTADDAVQLKGRAACEISSGDELVLTEMIFDGAFNDLPADVCAALLSCFVFDEKVAPPGFEDLTRAQRPWAGPDNPHARSAPAHPPRSAARHAASRPARARCLCAPRAAERGGARARAERRRRRAAATGGAAAPPRDAQGQGAARRDCPGWPCQHPWRTWTVRALSLKELQELLGLSRYPTAAPAPVSKPVMMGGASHAIRRRAGWRWT